MAFSSTTAGAELPQALTLPRQHLQRATFIWQTSRAAKLVRFSAAFLDAFSIKLLRAPRQPLSHIIRQTPTSPSLRRADLLCLRERRRLWNRVEKPSVCTSLLHWRTLSSDVFPTHSRRPQPTTLSQNLAQIHAAPEVAYEKRTKTRCACCHGDIITPIDNERIRNA